MALSVSLLSPRVLARASHDARSPRRRRDGLREENEPAAPEFEDEPPSSDVKRAVAFVDRRSNANAAGAASLFWVDRDGNEIPFGSLAGDEGADEETTHRVDTFEGHSWVLRSLAGDLLKHVIIGPDTVEVSLQDEF